MSWTWTPKTWKTYNEPRDPTEWTHQLLNKCSNRFEDIATTFSFPSIKTHLECLDQEEAVEEVEEVVEEAEAEEGVDLIHHHLDSFPHSHHHRQPQTLQTNSLVIHPSHSRATEPSWKTF
jgi:hypothetical protein